MLCVICATAATESEEAQLAAATAEEEFLQSAEVVDDGVLAETRAKLEYVHSVLGVITSIETAVPQVSRSYVMCSLRVAV
jgi:ribosome-binding ATPase YchF (GTP1/OBG family)